MISYDDIETLRRVHADYSGEVMASLRLRAGAAMSEFAMAQSVLSSEEVMQEAEKRCKREVWEKLYGDLRHDLYKLKLAGLRGIENPALAQDFAENVGAIFAKLAPPP